MKSTRNSPPAAQAKEETNLTARSVETVRRGASKRGVRVRVKDGKKRVAEEERRMVESSLSLRLWTAFESWHSSRTLAISRAKEDSSSPPSIPFAGAGAASSAIVMFRSRAQLVWGVGFCGFRF